MAGCCFSVLMPLLACAVWGTWQNYVAKADQESRCNSPMDGDIRACEEETNFGTVHHIQLEYSTGIFNWNIPLFTTSTTYSGCGHIRYVQFLLPDNGNYLEGHAISNLSIAIHRKCEERCLLEEKCVSINIGPAINDKMACELSDSDHFQHPEDLKPRHGWTYRGTENLCATSPCYSNRGKCLMGYTDKKYLCVCLAYYTGEHCEKALAKSCSDLKKLDSTAKSGSYDIDPDGEGGLEQLTIYCNMTDEAGIGVTLISHDSEERTLVDGKGKYLRGIHYTGASLSQLTSLTNVSSHCEQFIMYECRGSRLLKDGMAWWVSRDSTKMTYWGGASPGSGKCACGMNNSCAASRFGCNCDQNDANVWLEDSGVLTEKTQLPVTKLRFGDTSGGKELGYHTLGKFKCYGTA